MNEIDRDLEAERKREAEKNRPRSLEDRTISFVKGLQYDVTEPLRLRLARMRHERDYASRDTNPLVSVCVPTFNRADLMMQRSVPSVLAQSHANLELIIVGHHCTDDTEARLAAVSDPRLKFHNMARRKLRYDDRVVENHWYVGGAEPTNVALGMARGKWIARIDDDDVWTPNHIERLLDFAQSGGYEFVSSAYEEERHGVRKVNDAKHESPRIGGVQTWLYRSYLRFMRYNVQCYRKRWNRVWDVDLQDRIGRAGVRTGFLNEILAFVVPRPGEVSVGIEAYRLTEAEKLELYRRTE